MRFRDCRDPLDILLARVKRDSVRRIDHVIDYFGEAPRGGAVRSSRGDSDGEWYDAAMEMEHGDEGQRETRGRFR